MNPIYRSIPLGEIKNRILNNASFLGTKFSIFQNQDEQNTSHQK